MKYDYFTIEDATYAYTISGVGEPIVLLHGFTGSSETWKQLTQHWSNEFQVITVDLPGHGKTMTQSARTMKTFSNDLQQLLAHLHIDTCHLLGYSLGGRAALSFSMYYPEHVKTLTLESASPGLKTDKERVARIKNDTKLSRRLKEGGIYKFTQFWENIPLFQSQNKLAEEIRDNIRQERLGQSAEGLIQSLVYMGTGKQPSWWEKLEQLSIPTLLIVGEDDEKFVKLNKEMHLQIKKSQFIIIQNAGHTVHVEQVEKFVKIVMEHVQNNT